MSPLSSYRRLFSLAGPLYVVVAFAGRLPLAMAQMGTLLLVAGTSGSYAAGGAAAGALAVANAVGAPVAFGPSIFNFAQAADEAVKAGAAIQVPDAASLVREAGRLLADADARRRMGAAGKRFCAAHRGATERTMALVAQLLR